MSSVRNCIFCITASGQQCTNGIAFFPICYMIPNLLDYSYSGAQYLFGVVFRN